jgi:hypothetical protein
MRRRYPPGGRSRQFARAVANTGRRRCSTDAEAGIDGRVASDVEIDRALATVTATLNDQRLSEFDAGRIQEILTASLGGEPALSVDGAGGVHDRSGIRVGIIRRAGSGGWIAERQNTAAETSSTAVPGGSPDAGRAP